MLPIPLAHPSRTHSRWAVRLLACCLLATTSACGGGSGEPSAAITAQVLNPAMQTRSFFTASDGVRIAYRVDGPADKPVLVLSNSIATTLQMWDANIPELTRHFRVVRFDTRGHGASDAPPSPYALERFGRDVTELMDHLGIPRAHFLGLSLGGYIGQWLGIHAPQRIDRLVLSNTAAYLGPRETWDPLIAQALAAPDLKGFAETFVRGWFPASWVEARLPAVDDFRAMVVSTTQQGLAGSWVIVRDTDYRQENAHISRPTLVIGGRFDGITTAAHSEQIASTVPGAQLVILPTVHLPNIEAPREYLDVVVRFLQP